MTVDRSFSTSRPAAVPLHLSSVYALADLDMLERISSGGETGFIYARDNHPNAAWLADELAVLESGRWCVVAASGMGALVAAVLSLVKQGDRIIASDQLYGRSTQFLGPELARFGVETTWCDTSNIADVAAAFAKPVALLVAETISNPLLRVADIASLAHLTRKHGGKLLIDNTFATPALIRPLEFGANLVVESLTKFIGGHSDLTLGAVIGHDSQLGADIKSKASIWGMPGSPLDCWLAQRSLATLALRVRAASCHAAKVADWLATQAPVSRVIYPGRLDHPDHEVAGRMFAGPPGSMVTFELQGGRDAVNLFMQRASAIPFCPSLGDTATTCSYPAGTSHRYVDALTKQRLGITDGMIRLSVGIEPVDEIIQGLIAGL